MKKILVAILTASLLLAFAACDNSNTSSNVSDSASTVSEVSEVSEATSAAASEAVSEATSEATSEAVSEAADKVMTYAEYVSAPVDSAVCVETFVQAKQSWWEDKCTIYTQNQDGAFFIYNMACSAEDYENLTVGKKIKVNGFKSVWSGEVEITDATFEIIEGDTFVATAFDITSKLSADDLINYQNQFVSFKGMTVEAAGKDAAGKDVAFLYNYDGSGEEGSDLYFKVSADGTTYTFTVESYLCDKTTEVYSAIKALKIGDKVDLEGFLYWYEGVNPHITSCKTAA